MAVVVQRFRDIVDERQLSQRQLAALTGYRQSDISRFLRGDMKHPPLGLLDSLARACGYRLADIFQELLPAPTLPADLVQVAAALQSMPAEQRASTIRLVIQASHGAARSSRKSTR